MLGRNRFKVYPIVVIYMSHKDKGVKLDVRISTEMDNFITRLVTSGTYKNRSEVLRCSLEEFMAKYTGIPTLSSLDEQVKRLRFRCDGYDEELRILRRTIEEMNQ